jgi:hypothetical protein
MEASKKNSSGCRISSCRAHTTISDDGAADEAMVCIVQSINCRCRCRYKCIPSDGFCVDTFDVVASVMLTSFGYDIFSKYTTGIAHRYSTVSLKPRETNRKFLSSSLQIRKTSFHHDDGCRRPITFFFSN